MAGHQSTGGSLSALLGDGSPEHHDYAERILRPWTIEKTPELEASIVTMALSISNCPRRNHTNRPYETVLKNCKQSLMDLALANVAGIKRNSWGFDVRDASTYSHDAVDEATRCRFEVKTMKKQWLSWRNGALDTFLKHAPTLDYIVAGRLSEHDDHYDGAFLLIARAPTFHKYIEPSQTVGSSYYTHHNAGRRGHCIYRSDI